mgnify:CR=1 FL=1
MQIDLSTLFEQLAKASGTNGMPLEPGLARLRSNHSVEIPSAYLNFMHLLGPGSWGGFLHFHALQHMSTHEELLAPFMDEDLQEMLEPTADVLVFANSDNGDMCGWYLHDLIRMAPDECPVIRIPPRSFDGDVIASSTAEFFRLLADGANLFGVGALPLEFQPRPLA